MGIIRKIKGLFVKEQSQEEQPQEEFTAEELERKAQGAELYASLREKIEKGEITQRGQLSPQENIYARNIFACSKEEQEHIMEGLDERLEREQRFWVEARGGQVDRPTTEELCRLLDEIYHLYVKGFFHNK